MSEIANVIEIASERFNQIAPQGMQYEAEKGYTIQILKANNTLMTIAQKQPQSLQQAIVNVAAIGLSLSPAEKLAYLIPRGGKVCLDISYIGMCRIATNSGSIQWIQAELVYSNDAKFLHKGAGERPEHDFDPFATIEQRGDLRGGYCIAKTAGGDHLTTMMSAEDIMGVKNRSDMGKRNAGPWKTDFGQMAKKTVVRRAFNMWPRTDQHQMERMALAVQISNDNEDFEPMQSSPDLGQYSDEQKAYFDQMLSSDDALEMYVLQQTISEKEFANLYHSFEKGTKGKYQAVVDSLTTKGKGQFEEYCVLLQQGHDVESEVSEEAFKLIESRAE